MREVVEKQEWEMRRCNERLSDKTRVSQQLLLGIDTDTFMLLLLFL